MAYQTVKWLSEEEIDRFVCGQILGVLTTLSREFDVNKIVSDLKLTFDIKDIEASDIADSLKRLFKSNNLEIKGSNIRLSFSDPIGHKLRITCFVELAQKTQKEA